MCVVILATVVYRRIIKSPAWLLGTTRRTATAFVVFLAATFRWRCTNTAMRRSCSFPESTFGIGGKDGGTILAPAGNSTNIPLATNNSLRGRGRRIIGVIPPARRNCSRPVVRRGRHAPVGPLTERPAKLPDAPAEKIHRPRARVAVSPPTTLLRPPFLSTSALLFPPCFILRGPLPHDHLAPALVIHRHRLRTSCLVAEIERGCCRQSTPARLRIVLSAALRRGGRALRGRALLIPIRTPISLAPPGVAPTLTGRRSRDLWEQGQNVAYVSSATISTLIFSHICRVRVTLIFYLRISLHIFYTTSLCSAITHCEDMRMR